MGKMPEKGSKKVFLVTLINNLKLLIQLMTPPSLLGSWRLQVFFNLKLLLTFVVRSTQQETSVLKPSADFRNKGTRQ